MAVPGKSGILRKLKRAVKAILGRDFFPKLDCHCPRLRFGSPYGGWTVAHEGIGPDTVVYSFGIGEDASFDLALIQCYGLQVHAFDPTPKSVAWIKRQGFPEQFRMNPVGLAHFDGVASFHLPENPDFVSSTMLERQVSTPAVSVPVKRLATLMREMGHRRIDILKMDIEGAEYQVLEDLAASGIRPRQVLVEYHHRFPEVGIAKTKQSIELLRSMGYGLFHVSDSGEEFSFYLQQR
jgi:FkbM family methyltransferase